MVFIGIEKTYDRIPRGLLTFSYQRNVPRGHMSQLVWDYKVEI